ncbi:ABC transporter ATP-binding protein [Shinella sp.]|uniref:ABC transporter ATP-binding protein n=1 Tax=Shinella sp. TaxID=1870904 RepID=UPI003917BBF6
MMSDTLLSVQGVETYYGNIRALAGVDVQVQKGEIVSLIGANGAGKSTLMTVYENLQMGASLDNLKYFDEDVEKIFTLFPRLKERQSQRGGTLSGGEQQMLSIGRALMARPKLLLLDEPSLGLAPLIVKGIFDAIKVLNKEEGLTVFLVEQNAFAALKLSDRAYVMVNGKVTMSGSGKELLANPEVRAAYLEGGRH